MPTATTTAPDVLANAIMGKLYDVLTNGDGTVPASTDNFFSWCTPGIPITAEDFRFLSQGLTGVVTPQAAANLVAATSGTSGNSSGGTATAATGSTNGSGSSNSPGLTPGPVGSTARGGHEPGLSAGGDAGQNSRFRPRPHHDYE